MSLWIFENMICAGLQDTLSLDDQQLSILEQIPNSAIKERLETINDLKVVIYPNDHNPPHFHVISKDRKIDAKFTISDCSLISGTVSGKQYRRIKAYHGSAKGQLALKLVWEKYHG